MSEDPFTHGRADAEVYVDLALAVVDLGLFETRADVRAWWKDEATCRIDYGLTQEQSDAILYLCRDVATDLPEPEPTRRCR